MNKKIIVSLSVLALLAIAGSVSAFTSLPGGTPGSKTMGGLFNSIQTLIWQVFGILALVMFVVAGILFLTSGGDPEKVATARGSFIWGVVGIVVGIIAFSIMAIIQTVV